MTIIDDQPESQPVCDPVEPTEGNLFVSAYPPFSCWKPECVTDIDGSYSIPDLPPGDYVVEAWHEKYGTQQMNVTVGADASFTFSE